MANFPGIRYKHIKQLVLATGEINTVPLPDRDSIRVPITLWLANMNNDCLIYGCIYFIDSSCIEDAK